MIGKVKHPAVLLLVLICAMAAVPASADVLYDNITPSTTSLPGSYNVGAPELSFTHGYKQTDSFTLSQPSMLDSAVVGIWLSGATGASVTLDWAITTGYSGPSIAQGTATDLLGTLVASAPAYNPSGNIYLETFSLSNLPLAAGTYWLQLSNAHNSNDPLGIGRYGSAAWDDAFGFIATPTPTAYNFNSATWSAYSSQTFQILGSADTSAVPEPSGLLLLGTLLAGLGGFIRLKHLV